MTEIAGSVAEDAGRIYNSRAADLRPWGMGKYTGGPLRPTHEEIAQLAYDLYESRGRQDGHDVEDWLRAEEQLVQHYA